MAQEHNDDFLRQLASGELTGTQAPADVLRAPECDVEPPEAVQNPGAQGEPAEPVLTHPIDGSGSAHDTAPRKVPRQAEAHPQDTRSVRTRVLAMGALILGSIALIALIGGNSKSSVAQHARSFPSPQRAGTHGTSVAGEQSARGASSRGAPNGTSAPERGRLALRWKGAPGGVLRATWRSGGQATVTGRLSSMDGRRVRDALVSVLAADADRPAQGSRTVGEVRTDKTGAFQIRVAVDRGAPAKLLTFTYLARAQDTVPAAVGHARLDVYAPVGVSAIPASLERGHAVRLIGSTVPASTVELWAMLPGGTPWRRLASARSGRDGGWQATVHIGRDASRGTYTFQARVPSAASSLPGYSTLIALNAR